MEQPERPSSRRARGAIIGAATAVVLADGVEALTVRVAADRAGYSVASVYNHVDGIHGLLSGVRLGIEESLVTMLAPSVGALPPNAEGLAQIFVDYAAFFCERPHAFHLLFGASSALRTAAADPEVRAGESAITALWQPAFAGLVEAQELAPDRVEDTALHVIYLVHGALLIALSQPRLDKAAVLAYVHRSVKWTLNAEAIQARGTMR
jgi:AcrR family transcriptional regulator